MNVSRVIALAGALVLSASTLVLASIPPCSGCYDTRLPGPAINVSSPAGPTTIYACPGSSVPMSVSASDEDQCGDPYAVSDYPLYFNWSGAVTGQGSGGSSTKSYSIPSGATPGQQFTATCTVSDGTSCGDDPIHPTVNFTIIVKGLTGISGPTEVHKGDTATFNVTGSFPPNVSDIQWSPGGSGGASKSITFDTGGKQTVSATYCGKTVKMDVVVLVPCQGDCCCESCTPASPCEWFDPAVGLECRKPF